MGIRIGWDNPEQTVIRFEFEGKWNWYGYEMAVGESFGLMDSVGRDVDYLFNFENSEPLPEGATFYLKRTLELSPNGRSTIVMAHTDISVETTVAMFCRIYKKFGSRLLTARNVDKARAILAGEEPDAPAPKASVIRLIAAR